METIKLPYLKTLPTACMPTRATSKSVGVDLYSPTKVLIPAHDKVLVDMGVAIQIPMGYYGRIASRSGLAIHHHIHVGAGGVDPDYTGSIHVLLMNFSSQDHVIEKNHQIAQMILEKWLIQSFVRYHKCSQQSVVPKDLAPWGNKRY